ncbi:DUF1932 domain-containing protein [Actinoplanes sp. CA-015351]|uniref:NAD(P)-dependent oxidoreductase n=1 Tax=Actinoplanes sp. CA-015351 TaxID=3239897 RepID=UPI003D95F557
MTVIAVLGLGEAGSLIAADLVAAGASVQAYDPKVATSAVGVTLKTTDAEACEGADVVLSVNSAADAEQALRDALPSLKPGAIWADLNTATPALKERLAASWERAVDVALMSPVPGRGLRTPMTMSGPAAGELAEILGGYGADVTVLDGPAGAAATRKLLRSVFYKGMAAAVVEALEAAKVAGLEEWLRGNITTELIRSNADTLDRLVDGSRKHAVRRRHEMAAAAELLGDLGVPARVAEASRDWLGDLIDEKTEQPFQRCKTLRGIPHRKAIPRESAQAPADRRDRSRRGVGQHLRPEDGRRRHLSQSRPDHRFDVRPRPDDDQAADRRLPARVHLARHRPQDLLGPHQLR